MISNLATPYKKPFYTLGLSKYFDVEIFSCDCGLKKPDEAIYRLALKQLDSVPEKTLMIGDTYKADVIGPQAIGIQGILLNRAEGIGLKEGLSSFIEFND